MGSNRNTLYYTREVRAKRRRIIRADNESIRAVLKLYTKFDDTDKASCREYQDKLRVILSLHHNAAAEIRQGRQRPARAIIGDDPSSLDTAASLSWNRANNDLFSICFLPPKTQEDGVGNGQAAWAALREKYDGNTNEARR